MADSAEPSHDNSGLFNALLDDAYLFDSLLETTHDSIYVKDRQCRLVRVSRSMARNLGFGAPDEIVGLSDLELFGADFAERTYVEDQQIMETNEPLTGLVECRQLADGGLNWTLTSKMPIHDHDGSVVGLLGITREINDLKEAESNLQYLATHDSLTGLPNRFLMTDRLNQIVSRAERSGDTFAVVFVDVDNFKRVNDERGHAAGDELLRSIGERLLRSVRQGDTIARIGGDEFVLIIEDVSRSNAMARARQIVKDASVPLNAGGRTIRVSVSAGLAMYPEHGRKSSALITAADHAMYLAKKAGKNRHFVYPDPAERRREFVRQSM